MKDFLAINFSEYFKSMKEKLYSKLSEEQNLKKVAKSFYDEVEKYVEMMQPNSSNFKSF